jgi:enolase
VEVDVHGAGRRIHGPRDGAIGCIDRRHEAVELRDGGGRYLGKGVTKAVAAVNGEICDNIMRHGRRGQIAIDKAMIELDGTPTRPSSAPTPFSASRWRRQGAAAQSSGLPLYRYVGGPTRGAAGADDEHHQWRRACRQPDRLPGIHDHAGRRETLADAVRMGRRSSTPSRRSWRPAGHNTNVGDEGGFAPNLSATDALDFIMKSIEKAGYKPAKDIYLALDCAASTEFFKDGKYELEGEGKSLAPEPWRTTSPSSSGLSDHLDRGRHGRRRLGRLEGADRQDRRQGASWSATTCSSPIRACATASRWASPTRSWSRSTRSAR